MGDERLGKSERTNHFCVYSTSIGLIWLPNRLRNVGAKSILYVKRRLDRNTCVRFGGWQEMEKPFYERPVWTSARANKDCTTFAPSFYLCDDVMLPKMILLLFDQSQKRTKTCPGSYQDDVVTEWRTGNPLIKRRPAWQVFDRPTKRFKLLNY